MTKNTKIYAASIALLLIAVMMVSIAAAAPATFSNIAASKVSLDVNANTAASSSMEPAPPATSNTQTSTVCTTATATPSDSATDENVEKLREQVPKSLAEAQASIAPVRTKYLLYTSDGNHIMWGIYGNGRFTGTDNNGKTCWGIYEKGIFAGFYDGTFFYGKYSVGAWRAQGLFDLNACSGKYVLFPSPVASVTAEAP
jgi:hypothetical protein